MLFRSDCYLFDLLEKRDPAAKAVLDPLRAQHVQGAALVRELERSLLFFEEGWPQGAREFQAAVDAYAKFHWDHMRIEERDVLPRCEKSLKPEDSHAIASAFAGNEDPIADLGERDVAALFSRIVAIAPAPVRQGEPWKKAVA